MKTQAANIQWYVSSGAAALNVTLLDLQQKITARRPDVSAIQSSGVAYPGSVDQAIKPLSILAAAFAVAPSPPGQMLAAPEQQLNQVVSVARNNMGRVQDTIADVNGQVRGEVACCSHNARPMMDQYATCRS